MAEESKTARQVESSSEAVLRVKHWSMDPERRQSWELFLRDYTAMVQPDTDAATASVGHSVTYGSTALQALYILNGGALGVLPLLVSGGRQAIEDAAAAFVVGILLAGVSSICSYANFQFHAQISWIDAADNSERVQARYWADPSAYPKTDRSKDREQYNCKLQATLYAGVGAAVLSMVAFVAGAFLFMALAK